MNIHDMWVDDPQEFETSHNLWRDELLPMRAETFFGFLKIETKNGILPDHVSINSPEGQEVFRIFSFRVIEEAAESFAAKSPSHRKEEAIDAFNYLMSIPLLAPEVFSMDELAEQFQAAVHASARFEFQDESMLTLADIGFIGHQLGYHLADHFRNRAWMKQTQDMYFNGKTQMLAVLYWCTRRLMKPFNSFDEFYRFFVAKDRVLQFRLRTDY